MQGAEQVYVCDRRAQLKVGVNSGRLFVRGWDGNEVRVEDLGSARIRQKGNKVLIESQKDCELKLYLPRASDVFIDGTELELDLGGIVGNAWVDVTNGNTSVEDWQGQLDIDTADGNVRLSQCSGRINIDTSQGSVDVIGCRGNISVDTGAGSLRVADSAGSVTADTGGGNVTLHRFKGPVQVDTGAGNVELREISGRNVLVDTGIGTIEAVLPGNNPGRWHLDTGSGDVALHVPENILARFIFQGRASGLDVDDLALEHYSQSQDKITGSLNEARGNISVSSSTGNISARKIPAAIVLHGESRWADEEEGKERDEESLKILTMLEAGVISTAEAEKLLDALRGEADTVE